MASRIDFNVKVLLKFAQLKVVNQFKIAFIEDQLRETSTLNIR